MRANIVRPNRLAAQDRPLFKAGIAVLTVLALSACGTRPGPETLLPVANPGPGTQQITVLAVTDRTGTDSVPPVFGSGRGTPRYEELTLLRRRSAQGAVPDTERPAADPSKRFVTIGRRLMSGPRFDAEVSRMAQSAGDAPITVYVHGYNYSYQEAVFRLAQLNADLGVPSVPVLFSWPSDATPVGYLADQDSATYARDDLAQLLSTLAREHPRSDIAVIGHSMGAWLVMESLRQLRINGRAGTGTQPLDRLHVVLAAPDIDMDVFRRQADAVGPLNRPMTVLVSSDDHALAASSRLAGNRTRLGQARLDDPRLLAITRRNKVQVMDISSAPASDALNHDRYIGFAARWARLSQRPGGTDMRALGASVLDATGRIVAAPFSTAAQIVDGR